MIRDTYAPVITDLRSGQLTGSDRQAFLMGADGKPLAVNPIG
jgi:hypothetical protein